MKSKKPDKYSSVGPRKRESREPKGDQLFLNLNRFQQSFDKDAFNALVQSQGVRVVHYRAVPDPTGMIDKGDTHAVQSTRASSDGYIYKEAGTLQVFFSSNSSNFDVHIEGLIKNDTAVITPPEKYENCDDPVLLAPYDRFYLKDVEVRVVNQQFVEANMSGIDRLQYPATCVEHIIDSDGIEYTENQHFTITKEGHIKWISQQRPGWNVSVGKGKVYSIRYRYTPYFIVARHLHEIRVSQITDPATFERKVERMPYQVLVIREHILHDVNRDPENPIIDNRLQYAPPVGGALGSPIPPAGGSLSKP
jgi:hypothetical protein